MCEVVKMNFVIAVMGCGDQSGVNVHKQRYERSKAELTAGVNTNCYLPITFYSDSYRLCCKPSASLIACCC